MLDPPEHEGQSHRQAGQLTVLLSDAMRMGTIRRAVPEFSTNTVGACTDWELVLHAFFEGELNAADFLLASSISGDANVAPANERSEIDEAETQAFRQRVGCAQRLAKSNRLTSAFEAAFAAGLSGKARATDSP